MSDPRPTPHARPGARPRVVVTAQRRADDLAGALERRGIDVVHAPVLSVRDHVDDAALLARTRELVADPPDVVVVTTGVGLRGWLEAADAAGLGEALRAALAGARIVARGPKARGALQGAGLPVAFVAASETSAEVVEHLLAGSVEGLRVAVQHHGSGSADVDDPLRAAGADVVPLVVYAQGPSPDPAAVDAAVRDIAAGRADAVVLTLAPGVDALLAAADRLGLRGDVLAALRGPVLAAAIGPVTAAPLRAEGVEPFMPSRLRLGAMARELPDVLAGRPKNTGERASAGAPVSAGGRSVGAPDVAGDTRPVVLVSHGTRDPRGRATVTALARVVADRLPGREVHEAYVDVQEPLVADAVRGPAVVVPLLLSSGMHARHDIAGALADRPGVDVAPPLGAGAALAGVLLARAVEAGAVAGDALVVAAAGSRSARATADVERVADAVRHGWSGPVVAAHGAAARPGVADAVADLLAAGERVVVVPYLLAEGFFLDRLHAVVEEANAASTGATEGAVGAPGVVLAAPLGTHEQVVATVLARVAACGGGGGVTGPGRAGSPGDSASGPFDC